ncbi:hypothetical protein Bca52824_042457 [Brassica carinata]|uniref:Uncharacterized protein n=1 Tax=Brassica carinata TaxID=52824 RepID=A0A8X7RYE7_BRACI|nr:hypothetical protein Bca52824_042457 [Brassica carinata]
MELGHHDDTYQDRLLKIAEESSGNENAPRGQIIEALHDMDIGGSSVGAQLHDASMDVDATDDDDVDLLGEELKEMEEPHHIASSSNEVARGSKARSSNKGPSRHGILRGMPHCIRGRSTAMGDGEYASTLAMPSFGTDCKELIAMIKEPQEWPSFGQNWKR